MTTINIVKKVIQSAKRVYNELGSGFSEHIYHRAMEIDLIEQQLEIESHTIIPISYHGKNVGYGEADIIVRYYDEDLKKSENKSEDKLEDKSLLYSYLIIELKAIQPLPREVEIQQVKTYLRYHTGDSSYGMIINFSQPGTKPARLEPDIYLLPPLRIDVNLPDKELEQGDFTHLLGETTI